MYMLSSDMQPEDVKCVVYPPYDVVTVRIKGLA